MIQVQQLTQIYPSKKGIFDVTFDVKKGEVFGFLGPNGSGKTTTIRHFLGFANADQGHVIINGLDARVHYAILQKDLGYLPGEMAFLDNMTGLEFLTFLANMRGKDSAPRMEELMHRFQLESHFPIKKMSKGMKQKVGIVAALMHDPEILILDEPTSGLDPLMQQIFLDIIVEEKAKGKTIVMSSHIFDEVDRVCDRAAIIKDGSIIAIEDLATLRQQVQNQFVVVTESDEPQLLTEPIDVVAVGTNQYVVTVQQNYSDVLRILSQYRVVSMKSSSQSIESIFMKYYGDKAYE
jgi:ABC-2 type transport system ATP-binding protein